MIVVMVLVTVVICPPDKVDVRVTGAVVIKSMGVDVTSNVLVETSVIVVVRPSGTILVTVMNTSEVGDIIMLDGSKNDRTLEEAVGAMTNVVRPSAKLLVMRAELVGGDNENELDATSGGAALTRVEDVLADVVICPPGKMLEVTRVGLGIADGSYVGDTPGLKGEVATDVLTTGLGRPTELDGRLDPSVGGEDAATPGVVEIVLVESPEFKLMDVVEMIRDGYGPDNCPVGVTGLSEDIAGDIDDCGRVRVDGVDEGNKVKVDSITVSPEVIVVVRVVPAPGSGDAENPGLELLGGIETLVPDGDSIEGLGVRLGVGVFMTLERLGGMTLFNHSVVPLITE
ncbi:hypothetical protein M3J09_006833 [Ascochyta lentis]